MYDNLIGLIRWRSIKDISMQFMCILSRNFEQPSSQDDLTWGQEHLLLLSLLVFLIQLFSCYYIKSNETLYLQVKCKVEWKLTDTLFHQIYCNLKVILRKPQGFCCESWSLQFIQRCFLKHQTNHTVVHLRTLQTPCHWFTEELSILPEY